MAKLVLLLVFVCFQFSRSEELAAVEQVKLDLDEDEVPFTNQTAPDTEVLDGADESQWSPGPKFNSDWLNKKFSDGEEALNNTDTSAQSILDKLIAIAEMIAEYSDEEDSLEWDDDLFDDDDEDYYYDDDDDDDDDYDWDLLQDWDFSAEFKESLKNKNGRAYLYKRIVSLLKPKNFKDDKVGYNLRSRRVPVRRFTSV